MNQIILNIALKVLCQILCQFCDCCKGDKDCPDGVCGPLEKAIGDLESATPVTTATQPTAPGFDIDWSQLQPVIDSATTFIGALMKFLGLSPKVGG